MRKREVIHVLLPRVAKLPCSFTRLALSWQVAARRGWRSKMPNPQPARVLPAQWGQASYRRALQDYRAMRHMPQARNQASSEVFDLSDSGMLLFPHFTGSQLRVAICLRDSCWWVLCNLRHTLLARETFLPLVLR